MDMNNREFDSVEELHFSYYLDELFSNGYITGWMKNTKLHYNLFDGLKVDYIQQMKRVDDKVKTSTVLQGHDYTPDFVIYWTEKALGLFVQRLDSGEKITCPFICQKNREGILESIIEVKGDFDYANMTRLVAINIKWTYDKLGIFVNVVKVPAIFKKTFVPKRWTLTDKTKQEKKIKFKYKTLEEYDTRI